MVNFTEQQVRDYESRQAGGKKKSAEPQCAVCHDPLAEAGGEAQNSGRIAVRVTAFRTKLLDLDNLCPKFFIDSLRYSGLIPNDRPEDIDLSVEQQKCESKKDERTEITIEYP